MQHTSTNTSCATALSPSPALKVADVRFFFGKHREHGGAGLQLQTDVVLSTMMAETVIGTAIMGDLFVAPADLRRDRLYRDLMQRGLVDVPYDDFVKVSPRNGCFDDYGLTFAYQATPVDDGIVFATAWKNLRLHLAGDAFALYLEKAGRAKKAKDKSRYLNICKFISDSGGLYMDWSNISRIDLPEIAPHYVTWSEAESERIGLDCVWAEDGAAINYPDWHWVPITWSAIDERIAEACPE